jgi:hypothetical protein
VGAISLQALALFLALAPGCAFILGFHANSTTTRLETQRGVLMDTALFVLAAAVLHGIVGLGVVYLFHGIAAWTGGCDIVRSAGHLFRPDMFRLAPEQLCSIHTGLVLGLLEFLIVGVAALAAGKLSYRVLMNRTGFAEALYGAYYELRSGHGDPIVIANVMTDIECDGHILMYEGKLLELALSSNRAVKYVCLLEPQRFLMSIGPAGTATTERARFVKIDRAGYQPSRITINGENIKNLLTRTHYLQEASYPTAAAPDPADMNRRSLFPIGWLRAAFRADAG